MKRLGSRIREQQEHHKLSQFELAKLVKYKQKKISDYESGRVSPRLNTLVKLADALDTPTDYLLGGSDVIERHVKLEDLLS